MSDYLNCYGDCMGPLGFPMRQDDARELDKTLKEHSSDSALAYKRADLTDAYEYFIEKEHADVSVITDSSVDKSKEVIDADGVDFSAFKKNPLVPFNHAWFLPPVGKSIWQKKRNQQWIAKTLYIDRPDNHPKEKEWIPDTVWHMVKSGFMPAKSVGFLPIEARQPTTEERLNGVDAEIIFSKIKIFEYSVVTVGCNNNAIVEAANKGAVTVPKELRIKGLFDFLPPEKAEPDLPVKIRGLKLEEYRKGIRDKLYSRVKHLSVDTLVDDVLARLQGRV